MTEKKIINRKIKSFVLRTGRMTPGQASAYEAKWPVFGLHKDDGLLNFSDVFNREADTILEIGFGMGDSLYQMAQDNPNKNYVGVEVHTPGVGRLLNLASEGEVDNLRIFEDDAVKVIEHCVPDDSLAGVQIFFPDPWHKTKHQKRRIVQSAFIHQITDKLKVGGFIHLATDWEHYAKHMMSVLSENEGIENQQLEGDFYERPATRPWTKFERRGQKLGHGVWDLMFKKK